jgi:2-keto-4-pentenoate hydratase
LTDLMALDTVAAQLSDDSDQTLGQGMGTDANGHPLDALARLARELAANDQRLEAGDLVITGGLTATFHRAPGMHLSARFSGVDARSVALHRTLRVISGDALARQPG